MGQKKVVTVFGNPVEPQDALAVELVDDLGVHFENVDFQVVDPTENLKPQGDPWVILDVGMGLEDVLVIENLSQLEHVKGQSVHDYDVYMELRLQGKLGKLPKLKVIIIPYDMDRRKAFEKVVKILATLL